MKTRFFVNAASTISHQPTFGERDFSASLNPLSPGHALIQPPYKEYIDPVMLRRMSKILRMGVACSIDALKQTGLDKPFSIIVGTGLGCLQDTEKFLHNFLTLDGLLPPTSFILSTHNTVAGQISLNLGCNAYNITHTQNTVSFEMALLDGILKLEEGGPNALVGAADEHIPFLDKVAAEWGYPDLSLSSGASFFVLSPVSSPQNHAEVVDVSVIVGNKSGMGVAVSDFLAQQNLTIEQISIVLGGPRDLKGFSGNHLDYVSLCGWYPTASAFGFHFGVDFLRTSEAGTYLLIVNDLNPANLGFILLKAIET